MTCNKNCNDCIYGVPLLMYKCNDPNSTCNGVCSNCASASNKTVRWVCMQDLRDQDISKPGTSNS